MTRADNRGGMAFTREDMIDRIDQAIADTFELDWSSTDGAEGVLRECGVWELYQACELAIPEGVCLTNRNIPDGFKVALDCTMGDLRKIAAAVAKARGDS